MPLIGKPNYRMTHPVTNTKIAQYFRVALLFAHDPNIKSRYMILKMVGVPAKRAERKGELATMFTALNDSGVIKYDPELGCYSKGDGFKKLMQVAAENIRSLKKPSKEVEAFIEKEFSTILKFCSNAEHFIETT